MLSTFANYFWYPLYHIGANNPITTLQKEGNTVILSEIEHILVREVNITKQASWPGTESPHEMDVFMFNSACHTLQNDVRYHSFSGHKEHFQNISFYLMPQSVIQYNISASSNYSNADSIYVYIIPGLQEAHNFQPDKENDDVIVYRVKVGTSGEPHFTTITHMISHWNYYTIKTFIPNGELVLWAEYNMTVKEKYLNQSHLDNPIANATLDFNKASALFQVEFGFIVSCIIANIHDATVPKLHKYIHTQLNYTLAYKQVFATTVTPISAVAALCLIFGSTVFYLKRKFFRTTPWKTIITCTFKPTSRMISGRRYSRAHLSES